MRFVSNWSWDRRGCALPVAAQDVLSGDEMRSEAPLIWATHGMSGCSWREPGRQNDEEGRTP